MRSMRLDDVTDYQRNVFLIRTNFLRILSLA